MDIGWQRVEYLAHVDQAAAIEPLWSCHKGTVGSNPG